MKNERTAPLLKDLTAAMIFVRSDEVKEVAPPGVGETPVASLPPQHLCYLKLATAEQLHAIRQQFQWGIARVSWPEAVSKNKEREAFARLRRRSRPDPIPTEGRRFVFETALVLELLRVFRIEEPHKYYRGLGSCQVLALLPPPPAGKEGEVVKEPTEEWFSNVTGP